MPTTRILWGVLIVIFLTVLAAMWRATQCVAWRLGFQAQLGPPMDIGRGVPVYPQPAFFFWWYWDDA